MSYNKDRYDPSFTNDPTIAAIAIALNNEVNSIKDGPTGPAGPVGAVGAQGIQGIKGERGFVGSQGLIGPTGVKGDKGIQGAIGPAGGPAGPTGAAGQKGEKGQKGMIGQVGATGSQGIQGQQGIQGLQGQKGEVGEKGMKGSKGEIGDKGQKGEIGFTGQKGEKGEIGEKGDRGQKGDLGLGATGAKGQKGQKGEASTVAGPIGLAGATGSTGLKGNKGDRFSIDFVVNSVAALGNLFPVLGNFAIINSSVNDPDNSKLYVYDGTNWQYQTDMSGIQGNTGATGATGAQGIQGVTGATGLKGEKGDNSFNQQLNTTNNVEFSKLTVDNIILDEKIYKKESLAVEDGDSLVIAAGSTIAGTASDRKGGNLVLQGGRGKGNASGGNIRFDITQAEGNPANGQVMNPYETAMIITSEKKVGIGILNPTESLEINGKLKTGVLTFPNTDGNSNQILKTDGAGNISWGDYDSTLSDLSDVVKKGTGASHSYYLGTNNLHTQAQGLRNYSFGNESLKSIDAGSQNIGIGSQAGMNITNGSDNITIGYMSGNKITTAISNTVLGSQGGVNTTGSYNTLIGNEAGNLSTETNTQKNVYVGYRAGKSNTGSSNVFIGNEAGNTASFNGVSNKLIISNSSSTTPLIEGDFSNETIKLSGNITINKGNNTITFPSSRGSNGQILKTNGSGVLSWVDESGIHTFGISNTNTVKIDDASVSSGDYAKFTANGLQGKSVSELKTELNITKGDIGLSNVENTAISTWSGSSNLTTIGTLTSLDIDNININGNDLTSTNTNGDINITPNGNGHIVLDGIKWVTSDGTAGQILVTDGSGHLSWTTNSGGGGGASSLNDLSDVSVVSNVITFGSSDTTGILPADDNGVDLGSTAKSFKDAHIQGIIYGSKINNGTTLTLPTADGTNGQVLKTDGSGNLSWTANSAGSLAADDITIGDAAVTINTSSGAINIATNTTASNNVNIGTGAVARTVTIGNNTVATAISLTAPGTTLQDRARLQNDTQIVDVNDAFGHNGTSFIETLNLQVGQSITYLHPNNGISTTTISQVVTLNGTKALINLTDAHNITPATLSSTFSIGGIKLNGNTTISDGTNDFDIASHDGTNGLRLGGTLVTTSAAEINILDGSATTQASVTLADGDGVVISDGDVMKQCLVSDFKTYVADLTLTTAAQANITSVGTLTSLDVDNIKVDGNAITSTNTNGNITITPDGTGKIVLDGLSWPTADGTANQVLKTDGSGNLAWTANSSGSSITGAATTIDTENLTASRALISNASGKVAVSAVTDTELGYLDGVTSAIQTQIDSKQGSLTFGIANTNTVKIDNASVADNDYAKFTANGLEGRSYTEVKTDLSLNNVENTAISTWTGSGNIVNIGSVNLEKLDQVNYTVTSVTKTALHPYYNSGSSKGYKINGQEAAILMFVPGKTYRFDMSDNSNLTHPLLFYLDVDKNTQYTTNVTVSGTAGNANAYVEIVITDSTPTKLFYQCGNHQKMGNYGLVKGYSNLGTLTALQVDNIKVDGNAITSTDTNGNITVTPNGTGKIVLDGLSWPTADGTANHVLKTDGSGNLSWVANGSGGGASSLNDLSDVTVAANVITFGSADTTGILPADDNGVDLGSTAKSFKDAHIQGVVYASTLNNGVSLTLPTADGTANQVLKTDGSGNLSWTNNSGGGGGSSAADDISIGDAAVTINTSSGAINIATNTTASNNVNIGTGAVARTVTIGNNTGASAVNLTAGTGSINLVSSAITMGGHLIPATNDTFDIGSATNKIRDIYVSDNSLWIGDDHKIQISGGKMKFRKRKNNIVPAAIVTAGGNEAAALAHSSKGSLSAMTLEDWAAYGNTLNVASRGIGNVRVQDIFADNAADYADDFESGKEYGIGDTNALRVDGASTAGDFAKFTANGIVSKTTAQVKSDLSINNVENTAISTWTGSSNVTTVGTLTALQVDNIKVDGNAITSTDTNGNITMTPNGSGKIVLDGLSWPTADGSSDQVLKTDGSGTLSWTTASGGATSLNGLSDVLIENNSIFLGSDPSSTTNNAQKGVAVGINALDAITTGDGNVAVGYDTLTSTTTGNHNVSVGYVALKDNVSGNNNVGLGSASLGKNTSGNNNVSAGMGAMYNNTTGSHNVAIGYEAGNTLTEGSNNIIIGHDADTSANNVSNEIVIGKSAIGHGSNIVVIGNGDITAWHPADDNGVDLGSTSYSFKDAHIQGVIYASTLNNGASLTLPTSDGTNGQVLKTDGSGNLSWVANGSGGGASSLNDLSDVSVSSNVITFGSADTTGILPADDNGVDLGSTAKSFKDAHIQGVIYASTLNNGASLTLPTGDGTNGQVLKTDGSGNLGWVSNSATLSGAGSTIDTEDLTVSRALISNASGKVAVSAVTDTELSYLDGVTSAIQTQIDSKIGSTNPSISGTISVDAISERSNNHGVQIDSVLIKDNTITGNTITGHTITATNFNLGSRNVISASAQGSFSDIELKHNGTVRGLMYGETGNMELSGTLSIDTINEKTSASGVTIDNVLLKDNTVTGHTITATNFNLGSRNIVSASAQGSFSDLELKSNGTTGILAYGQTGNMELIGTLKVDTINENTTNGNISIAASGSGKIIIDGLSWPTADGTSGQVLKTDGSGNLSWVSNSATLTGAGSTIDTEDLTVSRALISNASGKVAVSAVTDTELSLSLIHI